MTTHNTREEGIVERAVIKLAATGLFEGKGDEVLQPFADWLLEVLTTAAQEKEEAVRAERERCLKALPDEYIIHEYMPAENTPARRGWNDYRNAAILAITTPPKNISSSETTV